ncbi:MAG: tetratricopeptide repeat protein [Deltaproteobacteria bacterium]|nr:tetratricopeptide repeat protein [Deltaproteobacteria bacterium]
MKRVAPPSIDRFSRYLFPAMVVVLSGLLYLNAIGNGFVYDDNVYVESDPTIRHLGNIWKALTSTALDPNVSSAVPSNYYRPLVPITYMLDYRIFGMAPWGFHLTNILFHALNSLLVYLIARKLFNKRNLALAAGLLFASHPIHTEAVAWIAIVLDVGCAFFLLLAFYLYMGEGKAWVRLPLSALAFFMALLYKETAVIFPLLLVSYEFLIRRGAKGYGLKAALTVYPAVALAYLAVRLHVLGGFAPLPNPDAYLSGYRILINSVYLLMRYLWMLVFPVDLNAFHTLVPALSALDPRFIISAAAFCAMFVVWMTVGKMDRFTAFAFIWVVLPLLPTMYLLKVFGGEIWNIFCERYLYLPSFGFVLFVSYAGGRLHEGLSRNPRGRAVVPAVFLAILFLYSAQTVLRNRVWRDNVTLYADGLEKSPGVALLHNNMGFEHLMNGRLGEAEAEFAAALRLDPKYEKAYFNLGLVYMKARDWERAGRYLETALGIKSYYADTYTNLGIVYLRLGRVDDARASFMKALEINPGEGLARKYLDEIYYGNETFEGLKPPGGFRTLKR